MGAQDQTEIEGAVRDELGAMGVGGTILLKGTSMELRPASGGTPVEIDLDVVVGQWPLLPEEMRKRKALEIAHRLMRALEASRRAEGRVAPSADAEAARRRVIGAVVGVLGLLALIGVARIVLPRVLGDDKPPPKPPTENEAGRAERLARACDAARDRLYKGTMFGPFALEGWAVELWLGRKDAAIVDRRGPNPAGLKEHPALAGLVSAGKIAPAADPDLAKILDGRVEITDGFPPGAAQPGWDAAAVVFEQGYARAFFEEGQRPRFHDLAKRIADATGADGAALYARCAHLTTHDVGAWFHGKDAPGAAAVLVYQMGMFAEGKVINRTALGTQGERGDLDALRKAAAALAGAAPAGAGSHAPADSATDTIGRLVTAQGGTVYAGGATLVFPLTGPVRPLAAAKELARRMGILLPTAE